MKTRIEQILGRKEMTATQFAEEIGVQRSSLSHILSGRNRPSLDFMIKIKERFPEIELDWLLLGKGEMITVPELGDTTGAAEESERQPDKVLPPGKMDHRHENQEKSAGSSNLPPLTGDHHSAVEAIVTLYQNGSFRIYRP